MVSTSTNSTTQTSTVFTSSALDLALQKIASVEVPQGKTIDIAYSGSIDATLCVKLAETKYHAKQLFCISVDVGQGQQEIQESIDRARKLNITPTILDARQEFTQHGLAKAIW